MPFLMVRNDITKMQVDAVVNPANSALMQGRGTSRAIYLAAGEAELTNACREIGSCEIGNAVLTQGFALPAKYVIHAVCPQWQDGKPGEKEILGRTYRSALELAKTHGVESIAFPLLSSGFYGCPKEEALHAATVAISEFLLHEDMMVYLVLYDHESVEVSKKLFVSIEEYIDDHYVGEKYEQYNTYEDYRRNKPAGDMVREESAGYLFDADSRRRTSASAAPAETVPMPPAVSAAHEVPTPLTVPWKKSGKGRLSDLFKGSAQAKERKLEDLMKHMDETFSEMLLRLIDERGLKDSVVYRKANIDRRLFSKIRKDANYVPTKKTVIAFAIALELSVDETKDLLMKAGYAFSDCSKFDVIISFFIENGLYDVFEINEVLFAYGQPVLGE
ncbi:MAG: macro domain-containing protein [Brotaphodocola sp.]